MQTVFAYPLVPVANFLATFIVLIPLPWLLQHWNTGAWTHSIWTALICFITGVNTTLWADNVKIKAVVWCDIAVRITHGASLSMVTTNFVMARRLCLIMNIQNPLSPPEKRKAKMFDLFVSVGIPVISMALSWFVQGHRFTIIAGFGCTFAYYVTPIYVALYEAWFLVFAGLAAIYGGFIFRALIRRRNDLRDVTIIDPEISLEKFRRVIALGCVQCLITLPCALYIFISNVAPGLAPWKGLADAHWRFSAIWQVPAFALDRRQLTIIQWDEWVTVFVAVVFFLFFGSSRAMWRDYWNSLSAFARRCGFSWPSKIARTRSTKRCSDSAPPMVFNIRTTIRTSTSQSRVTDTLQGGESEARMQFNSIESGINECEQADLEKGLVTEIRPTESWEKHKDGDEL